MGERRPHALGSSTSMGPIEEGRTLRKEPSIQDRGAGSVAQLFVYAARCWPGIPCVEDEKDALTFAEVLQRARSLAGTLVRAGVRPDDRVALWMATSVDWYVADVAISMAGAVMVPVNAQLRPDEVRHVLRQTRAAAVVMDGQVGDVDANAVISGDFGVVDGWTGPRVVVVRGGAPRGASAWSTAINAAPLHECVPRELDAAAYVLFTSGTTSLPKGVVLTHRNVLTVARNVAAQMGWAPGERNLCAVPFYSSYGAVTNILGAMWAGATTVCAAKFSARSVLDALGSGAVDSMVGVDTMYRDLVALCEVSPDESSRHLRSAVCVPVTGRLVTDIKRHLHAEEVYSGYGLTEASACSALALVPDGGGDDLDLAALGGIQFRVVDPVTLRPVAVGETGELQISGETIMVGYEREPEETTRTLVDGWLRTGDLAEAVDNRGTVRFRGRSKDVIKSAGFTISAAEVERVLELHPDVVHAALVGVPDPRLTEVAVAYVVSRHDAEPSGEDLRAFCGERLARYKVPRRFIFLEELPLTGTGKVQKAALRKATLPADPS